MRFYTRMAVYHSLVLFTAHCSVPFQLFRGRNVDNFRIVRYLTLYVMKIPQVIGLNIRVRGLVNYGDNDGKAAIIVSNHQSSLDMMPLCVTGPHRLSTLAKKELAYLGAFGLSAWLSGVIFINRLNREKAIKTMDNVREEMLEKKLKIWIFPEGTRNKESPDILPFKKGAFHLAVNSGVKLIPVVFSSYWSFYNRTKKNFNDGTVYVSVLPPVSTEGYDKENLQELIDNVRDSMVKEYEKISGLSEGNVLGGGYSDWLDAMHMDDKKNV